MSAEYSVTAIPTFDRVVAKIAIDQVVAAASKDEVISLSTIDGIGAVGACRVIDRVVTEIARRSGPGLNCW